MTLAPRMNSSSRLRHGQHNREATARASVVFPEALGPAMRICGRMSARWSRLPQPFDDACLDIGRNGFREQLADAGLTISSENRFEVRSRGPSLTGLFGEIDGRIPDGGSGSQPEILIPLGIGMKTKSLHALEQRTHDKIPILGNDLMAPSTGGRRHMGRSGSSRMSATVRTAYSAIAGRKPGELSILPTSASLALAISGDTSVQCVRMKSPMRISSSAARCPVSALGSEIG